MLNKLKIKNSENGVSLIITFFIMIIILAVVLAISTLLYSQIKVIKNIGNSVVSFYVADSGVEKVLFYDRQVKPTYTVDGVTVSAIRGLCSIFDTNNNPINNSDGPNYCAVADSGNTTFNQSIFCNAITPAENPAIYVPSGPNDPKLGDANYDVNGCDPDKCDDCEIDFSTNFTTAPSSKSYIVRAKITLSLDKKSTNFSINSDGSFEGVDRAMNLSISKLVPQQIIDVKSATVTPATTEGNPTVIQAEVRSPNGISAVYAYIKPSSENTWSGVSTPACPHSGTCVIQLACDSTNINDRTCTATQNFPAGAYYIDLDVFDSHNIELIDSNIQQNGTGTLPTFEIYSGSNAYPVVTNMNYSDTNGSLIVSSNASSPSGISSVSAVITDSNGTQIGSVETMQLLSGVYVTNPIDSSSFPGNYNIYIKSTDNLSISNPDFTYKVK